jgi:type IV pilus assembly protein PilC
MPTYRVEFSASGGPVAQAGLNAPSLPALAERLQEHDCRMLRVLPQGPDPRLKGYWRRVSESEVCTLFRQLAVALSNGVSVAAGLALIGRETHNPVLRGLLADAEQAVRGGDTLSSALARYPKLFPAVHIRLLEAGESGHQMEAALRHLADYTERSGQAALRIRTSLVYPQVVGLFTLALLVASFVWVVPRFAELFSELGVSSLPLATRALLVAGSALIPASIVAVPLGGFAWWWLSRRSEATHFRWAHLKLRLPVLGAVYYHFALLRLTRLLASLLRGGVPLLEALRLAGQGAENALLQAAMWDAIPRVAAGEPLAAALGHSGILPPSFCGQIAAAETTGDLPASLERLADWYGERVDYLAARVGAALEPVFILVLGILAGWVAFGVLGPLVAIIQSLSGGGAGVE